MHPFYVDLEWQIVYVGSASSEAHDQTLDSVLVGPVPAGRHRFVFQVRGSLNVTCVWMYYVHTHTHTHTQANSPNPDKLPSEDVVGVTVVLLTCSFRSNEFVRVGYYVNNEYADPELAENPPTKPVFEKVNMARIFIPEMILHSSSVTVTEKYSCQQSKSHKVQD